MGTRILNDAQNSLNKRMQPKKCLLRAHFAADARRYTLRPADGAS
ncbi:hypothetical protein C8R11_13010 [Nitrosomonas aestuarii]|nr:hypothetical protein C8R11_13010 [Nitrosomonas aestuarii]